MNMIAAIVNAAERAPLPDAATRAGIALLVGNTSRRLAGADSGATGAFAADMARFPIAQHTDDANAQHYELPAEFFGLTLGPRRKYSCCLYETPADTLADAEINALRETAARAGLADGQTILELGCGWGSLSLFMAETYPGAEILAVSNSHGQRAFIEGAAARRNLRNLTVVTADMNDFAPGRRFDRIVSVEMFEHMSNWRALLTKAKSWLAPDGRMFVHVFAHRASPYRFDRSDPADWIAQHFFTGGIMPSKGLMGAFPDLFAVEEEWWWSGDHYARTASDWLARFDENSARIDLILEATYGGRAKLWKRRWRLFYLATEGLFGYRGGSEWGVAHYRLRAA
jgi:cyclopropane-fatty-acyl-phospholipid synthase